MRPNYAPFVDRMIQKYEGGYCWDKADPGGPTKYGITCYDYAEFCGEKMTSMAAWVDRVKAMPLSHAEEIYRKKYATKTKFDDLGAGKDTVLFDYGVNSGVARPPRVAAALLKRKDTTMTPELVAAINGADPIWFIDAVCQERLAFMKRIRNGTAYEKFGVGWKRRVDDLDQYSDALAKRAKDGKFPPAVIPPDLSNVPTPKAQHPEPSATTNAGGTTGGGVTAGTAAAAAGFPVWAVVLVVAAVIAGGVALYFWNKRRAKKANELVIIPAGVGEQPK